MSDMVPEVLNAALDSLFTPKEPGEQEYQGVDGLLYCRNCHTPVQCRVKLWGRDKIVPCLCRCQQEAMAEKKRQDELVERQRKIRQLKATGIQEKHLLEWNFAVAEDNKERKNRVFWSSLTSSKNWWLQFCRIRFAIKVRSVIYE